MKWIENFWSVIILGALHLEESTVNTANSQIYTNLPRGYSVISLLNSYLDINFDVLHTATNNS